jgi:O-methyltransferase involved in polyketide biosynthesis
MRLDATASLVMLWSLPLYDGSAVRAFVDRLDLTAGRDLYALCNDICPWYGEVILNRKYCIRHWLVRRLISARELQQVVILAAGKSPLALEALQGAPGRIERIIEVDIADMEEKAALYSEIAPDAPIRCLTADISGDTLGDLLEAECSPELPTVVVMEGITYYISEESLGRILDRIRTDDRRTTLVIEYLLPCTAVAPERRWIPSKVFDTIRAAAALPAIRVYAPCELDALVEAHGGRVCRHATMTDMERLRTGNASRFSFPADGWIGCLEGRI